MSPKKALAAFCNARMWHLFLEMTQALPVSRAVHVCVRAYKRAHTAVLQTEKEQKQRVVR